MADAIWVRIEAALDVEMPVVDTPAPSAGKPFFNDPAVWMISAGILAIIITLFILFKNWKTAPPPHKELPQPTAPAIQPDSILHQEYKPPGTQEHIPGKKTAPKNEKRVADTAAQSVFVNREADSLLKKPPAIIPPPVIIAPPAVKIPPPGTTSPPMEIKPKKYGIEIPDTGYRFNVHPKE
jgi:hypothetical protein